MQIAFYNQLLVSKAGLLFAVALAHHLSLRELAGNHADLGDAPGRDNTGDKMLAQVASALPDDDWIDDTNVLRAGRTGRVLGCVGRSGTGGLFPYPSSPLRASSASSSRTRASDASLASFSAALSSSVSSNVRR